MSLRRCAEDVKETTRAVPAARRQGSSNPTVKARCPRWLIPNCCSNPFGVRPQGVAMTPALFTRIWRFAGGDVLTGPGGH